MTHDERCELAGQILEDGGDLKEIVARLCEECGYEFNEACAIVSSINADQDDPREDR